MKSSKQSYKRLRPALGTFVGLKLETELPHIDLLISDTYREIQRLESIFNFHDSQSILSKINSRTLKVTDAPIEFLQIYELALQLEQMSSGAFCTQRINKRNLIDLNGIAKGFIVDKAVDFLASHLEVNARGSVNAGGDLKYFGELPSETILRLGKSGSVFTRQVQVLRKAIASSSRLGQKMNARCTTIYPPAGPSCPDDFTVVAQADQCQIADAMTKVGLFATPSTVQKLSRALHCQVMYFDETGQLARAIA